MKNINRKIVSIFGALYTSFTFSTNTPAKSVTPPIAKSAFTLVRVIDGDTIVVTNPAQTQLKVRLACIDAPEVPHSQDERQSTNADDINQYYWGMKAKSYVQSLIHPGDAINLTQSLNSSDRYGRIVAEVRTAKDLFIQQSLVSKGLAVPYFLDNCPSATKISQSKTEVHFTYPQTFRQGKY